MSSSGGCGRGSAAPPRLTAAVCRNLLHNCGYNPTVIAWVEEELGCFKITSTAEFAETWGRMKSNRSASVCSIYNIYSALQV